MAIKGVFLSHSSRDNAFCERLALDLLGYDVKVWYDEWEIKVGDSLREKIAAGIETHDHLAVVLSRASVQSEWVRKELNAALAKELEERQVIVLPLLIEDCEIPVFLKDKKWADFRKDYDCGLKEVLEVLGAKRRRRARSVSPARGSRHRNDELALAAEDFEDWFLDRLEEGNDIRIQRYLWNWRDAIRGMKPELSPDEIPAKQINIDDAGQVMLDKLAISANALVRYDHERWFRRVAELVYDAYIFINGWGTRDGASADWNVRPSEARCRVLDVVFAVGAAALEEERYAFVGPLLHRTTADKGYWKRRSWFRYTLTMAARGDPQRRASWYLPVGRAIDYIRSQPTLQKYFRGDEAITDYVCQFDLLQGIYWVLHSEPRDLAASYPTCALYAPCSVEPLVRSLITRQQPATVLEEFSDDELADILKGFEAVIRERAFLGYAGWADEGWDDPVIKQFLASHGEGQ